MKWSLLPPFIVGGIVGGLGNEAGLSFWVSLIPTAIVCALLMAYHEIRIWEKQR